MRYTTIIDISQAPAIYKSENLRLVYLHLCLTCGYHDDDKGLLRQILRQMASEVGCTMSALRHALRQLEKWQLVRRYRGKLYVRNWCEEQPITTPAKRTRKAKADQAEQSLIEIHRQHQEQLERSIKEARENAISYEEYKRRTTNTK